MVHINLSDIAILKFHGDDYRRIIIRTLQQIKNLFSIIKMDKEILTFGDIEIEKN